MAVMLFVPLGSSSAEVTGAAAIKPGPESSSPAQSAKQSAKPAAEPAGRTGQVIIDYVAPTNTLDKPLFDRLRAQRVLEKLQAFFSPLRLPRPLKLRLKGCDGEADAYYENGTVTVCVEAVYDMVRSAQNRSKPKNLDQKIIVLGGFFHVFLHEVSHAVFDYFKTPIFGREEDAADQLAAYVILNLEPQDSLKLVRAAIYLFADEAGIRSARQMNRTTVRMKINEMSGFHSTPAQRLYNILCMAYGSNRRLYAVAVNSGALPRERAAGCQAEYEQTQNAYRKLIMPHIDLEVGRQVKVHRWLSLENN
jgi:hypothetical protein